MKYKMIVTDLDGTLLRYDKTISDFTKDVINFLPFLNFDAGIYHNGAVICENGVIVSKCGIENPVRIVRKIINDNPGIRVSVEANDVLYANFNADSIWSKEQYLLTEDFSELENCVADKIIVEAHSLEEMQQFEKYLTDDLYLRLSEHRIAMIMNKGVTKSNAIKYLADDWGISMEKVVAFGDDYNDMDMLEMCGMGVAVGNALEAVKEVADEVCGVNEEDGLTKWVVEKVLREI